MLNLILLSVIAFLLLKTYYLRRSLERLTRDLEDILSTDTNVLLSVSTGDRVVRRLAAELNRHLRTLRALRRRYKSGDRDLRESVTNLSHDLRTPLTAICGYLDLLEQEPLSPASERYLSLIRSRADAMRQLTEELFRYSLARSGAARPEPEDLDLRAAVEEAAAGFYAALTARGIVPEIVLPEQPVRRRADREAVSRVLENVLSNALKYSVEDLEIVLTEGGEVRCTNTAPGLDEVSVGRLFDRYFTVEAACGGAGLGLAIAKALMENMGGSVAAQYDAGRLTVIVTF